MDSYRRLEAWRLCHDLAIALYKATEAFPGDERFGLARQIRKAAVSAAANIAEGHARHGAGEFRHFLSIALGSLAGVDALLAIAAELGYLEANAYQEVHSLRTRASQVTYRLQRHLGR